MSDSDNAIFKTMLTMYFSGTNPEGYQLHDFYGVMMMKYKRNGQYKIQLQYDYTDGHPINGKGIFFENFDAAIRAYELLERNSTEMKKDAKQKKLEAMLLGNDSSKV
jgi:hypothetical protein